MPSNFETTIHSRIWKLLALLALAVMACAGLAGCGGGGSGGGEEVTIVPQPSPDLVVESVKASDASPVAGADITLSVTVRNAGGAAAPAAAVRFYRSDDAVVTTSDEEVGAASVAELSASGSAAASVSLSAPQAPGLYYYGACADAVEGESDTANNCSTAVRVTVPGSRPDLVVESPSVSDANPIAGADITLSATVRNDGGAAASATTLRFYRSDDAAITISDAQVGVDEVGELAPSESHAASMELSVPSTPGTYHYGACVAVVAGESDTANNCSPAVRVTVPASEPQFPTPDPQVVRPGPQVPSPPDLVVEPPSVREETNSGDGEDFRIIATVRNAGGRRSGWTTLRVYYSRDETVTKSDAQAFARGVSPVRPSKKYSWSMSVTMPSGSGVYYYVACADALAEESDTTNNCSAPVRVTVPAPDLVAGAFRASDADLAAGGVFVLSVSVRNAGGRTSAATTVRVYRSDDATFTTSDPQVRSFEIWRMYPRGHRDGNSRVWRMFVRTPSSKGDYYYRACADAVAGESDTANNCSASLKVEVTHAKPNLHVSKGSWSSHAGIGNSLWLFARVRNLGGGASAATTLRVYLLPDETSLPSSGTEVAAVAVPPLPTLPEDGDPERIRLNPRAPSTPGRYYYVACVDAVADESDTTDNCTTPYWVDVVR